MLRTYLVALVTFFSVDMVWLGWVARDFYREQIGHLLRGDVLWPAAVTFYLIFVAALVHFVVVPARQKQKLRAAILNGAFFGLATYSTYDLTNLAVARDWPLLVTAVDLIWGSFLGATVSGVAYAVSDRSPRAS